MAIVNRFSGSVVADVFSLARKKLGKIELNIFLKNIQALRFSCFNQYSKSFLANNDVINSSNIPYC